MTTPPDAFDPKPGVPLQLDRDLRVVLAPNASPMTERGTNTYLLGAHELTVIDPGPDHPGHIEAIRAACPPGARITRILVTHTHLDHSPGAARLAAATGAPVMAYGRAGDGRSARMEGLDLSELGGGEGIDLSFRPDQTLSDGHVLTAEGESIIALHTPGHLGNHLCFRWRDTLFSGDHLMGWAPSLISPPDGDLTDFMHSLNRVEALGRLKLLPGHGAPVADGAARAAEIRAHRLMRETALRSVLQEGVATTPMELTRAIYHDVPDTLLPAALRNVLAHLIDLHARGAARFERRPGPHAPIRATRFPPP